MNHQNIFRLNEPSFYFYTSAINNLSTTFIFDTFQEPTTHESVLRSKNTYWFVSYSYYGKPQKKVIFLVAGPLRGGGGLNGCATKEKSTFLCKEKTSYGH